MVSDSGCGISEAEQATLFHRYAQARQGRQQTGSGLGLVICKRAGCADAGSPGDGQPSGRGDHFHHHAAGESLRDSRATGVAARPPARAVDTDSGSPTNRLLLKRQLSTIGCSVDEACDGEEAENKLAGKHYDL